jgi:cyanophycin synthetase
MDLVTIIPFPGPNRWAGVPVIEAHVSRRPWSLDRSLDPGRFVARWGEWLPRLETLAARPARLAKAYPGDDPPVARELRETLARKWMPTEILERATRLLEVSAGVGAFFGTTSPTDDPDVDRIVFQFEAERHARACLDTALAMCLAAARGEPFEVEREVRRLVELADDARLGPSSLAIIRAATARGISHRRLNPGSLMQLGEGCRQRRVWTAQTDQTSAIAEGIAQDKELTKRLLRIVGVPVPLGRAVTDPEDAWKAALEVGVPVAVKPGKANHARGVSLDLRTAEEVAQAFAWAVKDGEDTGVLVEQYAPGQPHRLLVVGDRLVAAARGDVEEVVGDGHRTIRELVDEVNRDPRRGENYTDLLSVLKLDDSALIELGKQGYTPESVPPAGVRVLIQRVGDLTIDCTREVHPRNAAQAVLAARVIGLDIAGIDAIAEDISRPFEEQRGAILEVNTGPSLSMHIVPMRGEPQPVGEAILDLLFPDGDNGRVPIVVVAGGGDRAGAVRAISAILQRDGRRVGWATGEGLSFEDRPIGRDGSRPAGVPRASLDPFDALLMHPDVEAIVVESPPESALARGLGGSRVDVAVVVGPLTPTGNAEDRNLLGALPAVRAVPPEGTIILPRGLHAAEPLASACRGSLILFEPATEPDSTRDGLGVPLVGRRNGGWWFAPPQGETTTLAARGTILADLDPPTALAALAATWALGIRADRLRALLPA